MTLPDNLREELTNELLALGENKTDWYLQNAELYFAALESSSAKIKGKTIKSFFHPYVLANAEFQWIREKAEMLWSILEKTGDLLIEDQEVADYFEMTPELEDLLSVNPGYNTKIPITRFDAFYRGRDQLQFCEFNADGTSGMNETNTMEECFLDTGIGQVLMDKFALERCELRKSLLQALLDCYYQYQGNNLNLKKPNIAIVDFLDRATLAEFEALRAAFIQEGYRAEICDPRDLTYREGGLWKGNYSINLVYRRVVTSELLERYHLVGDFVEAYRRNAFCMVGSFRSEAAHSKLVFTFLTSPAAQNYFSAEELAFINQHIPRTNKLDSKDTIFVEKVLKNKDNYVIKPHNSYGSYGLHMGKDTTMQLWKKIVSDNLNSNYIAQEVIDVPTEDFVTSAGKTSSLKVNASPFLYNGKLSGFYTRVSEIDIITTSRGGALIPTFVSRLT